MNKNFTAKLLSAMMLLTMSMTISAQTKKATLEGSFRFYYKMTPADYSVDNKSSLYFCAYGDDGDGFSIFDKNFNKQKTIDVPVTTVNYYTLTQERQQEKVVMKYNSYSDQKYTRDDETGEDVYEFTAESAENYVKDRYTTIRTKTETSEAIFFYPTDGYYYYGYEIYGYQYPGGYYKYEKSTSYLYECSDDYGEAMTYTDTWGEPVRVDYHYNVHPESLIKASDVDTRSFYLSQTLFNTDDTYEYVLPIYTVENVEETQEKGWDEAKGQEVVVRKKSGTTYRCSGFRIVNESGATVNSIMFDSDFDRPYSDIQIIDLDGQKYLAVEGILKKSATESVSATIVYAIDPLANAIRQVSMEEGMRVSPTMAHRSDMITITLEGNSNKFRQVSVVNAAGKTVKRVLVPAGQSSIQVNASDLSTGLNIVNVDGQKGQACKIFVR